MAYARHALLTDATPDKDRPLGISDKTPVREVFDLLSARLKRDGLLDEMDYFSISHDYGQDSVSNLPFYGAMPGWRWVSCFAVTGGSEGHYIHIEVAGYDKNCAPPGDRGQVGHRMMLFLGKTFAGMEKAQSIANRCAILLDA